MKTIKIKLGSKAYDDLIERYKEFWFRFTGLIDQNVRYDTPSKKTTVFGALECGSLLEATMNLNDLLSNLSYACLVVSLEDVTYTFGE